jgi:DNA-binding transcriptional ArsR family regulator
MSGTASWRGNDETAEHAISDLNADLDEIFGLLSHPRRRALLYLLAETDEDPIWTANLAVRLARIEGDEGGDPHDEAEAIALALRHNHLPKLADAGLVEVDASMTTVSYEGDERVADLLTWSRPREAGRTRLHTE